MMDWGKLERELNVPGYPNEGAFVGSSSFPIPYLNSFSAFGR